MATTFPDYFKLTQYSVDFTPHNTTSDVSDGYDFTGHRDGKGKEIANIELIMTQAQYNAFATWRNGPGAYDTFQFLHAPTQTQKTHKIISGHTAIKINSPLRYYRVSFQARIL